MDDDNGLDLTLSLPCGGPSSSQKGKNGNNSEVRSDEADRGSKLIDDFKNFLDGSNHKEESTVQKSKPEENLFFDLSKGNANVDTSSNSKRKNMFEEINNQKRHERDVYLSNLTVNNPRTPHVEITTDEGSTAENEDVADSEADGSTSKLGLSEGNKEVDLQNQSQSQSQRRFTISSEKHVPFSGQSVNVLNMPYPISVKESNSNSVSGSQQPVIPANLPLMFGYSPVQVNTVEAGKSEGVVSHLPQFQGSYFGRGPPNTNKQNDGFKVNQATTPINAPKPFERPKPDTKQALKEEGPSTHTDPDTKGINVINQPQAQPDIIPPEYPSIRPGISTDLKFGGSGSSPNLPWVSTTGSGPNGKTISGVTYRYSGTQIRIVCACHGSHLSPEEFIQHANEEQVMPPGGGGSGGGGGGGGLPAFQNGNPAASAQN